MVHEIPNSPLAALPAGLGAGSTAHRRPSHRSASASYRPAVVTYQPTAVQAVAEAHDTPDKPLQMAPAGFGVS